MLLENLHSRRDANAQEGGEDVVRGVMTQGGSSGVEICCE